MRALAQASPRSSAPWRSGWSLAGIGLVLALGAFLRFNRPDLGDLSGDEATVFNLASALINEGKVPLTGLPISLIIEKPPVLVYLLAIPLFLSRDVLLATLLEAGLSVLGIAWAYRFLAQYFGRVEALLGALLFATSFWAVFISRKAWDIATILPLTYLVSLTLLAAIALGKRRHIFWTTLLLAVIVQIHPAGTGLVLGTAATMLLFWRRLSWRWAVAGVAASVLPLLPYLYYLATSRFAPVEKVLALTSQPATYDLAALWLLLQQLVPSGAEPVFRTVLGSVVPELALGPLLRWILGALWFLGMGHLAVEAVREWRTGAPVRAAPAVVLLFTNLGPVLFYFRHTYPIAEHYVHPMLPAAYATIAVGAVRGIPWLVLSLLRLYQRNDQVSWASSALVGSAVVLVAAGVLQAWLLFALLNWVEAQGSTLGYGTPMRSVIQALHIAAGARGAADDAIFVAAHGERPQIFGFLASGRVPVRMVDDERGLVFPQATGRPVVYVTTADKTPAVRFLEERFGADRLATIEQSADFDSYRVYRLPPTAGRLVIEEQSISGKGIAFANGIELLGVDSPATLESNQPLNVTLRWRVARLHEEEAPYSFFVHLVDANGKLWAQADGIGYPPSLWQVGDSIIGWHSLRLEPGAPLGTYRLLVGLYRLDSLARVPLEGAAQNSEGMALTKEIAFREEQ